MANHHSGDACSFSDYQMKTLSSIFDALIPSLSPPSSNSSSSNNEKINKFYKLKATDLRITKDVMDLLSSALTEDKIQMISISLSLLGSTAGCYLLTGCLGPFQDIEINGRIEILKSWQTSMFEFKRLLFQSFKSSCSLAFFGCAAADDVVFPALDYPGPKEGLEYGRRMNPNGDAHKIHKMASVPDDVDTLHCDVLIVGSGAGGGVVAAVLAKAGFRVIVVEKATYINPKDYHLREMDSLSKMYEQSCVAQTETGSVSILAGSTFGGGTAINWSASLVTPKSVTDEWASKFGAKMFATPVYQEALDAVCKRLSVHDTETIHNDNNSALWRGAEKLNFAKKVIPRNAIGSHQNSYSLFGCASGEKNSTLQTWLYDAALNGAVFIENCFVDTILRDRTQKIAIGVEATLNKKRKIQIFAHTTVLSAGSLHSPAIMLRSKIPNKNIGKNLRLHPVVLVQGFFNDKVVKPYDGTMMSTVVTEFANFDKTGYGPIIETPPLHPGLFSVSLPWNNPVSFKERMLKYRHAVSFIVLTRDRGSGEVVLGSDGLPRYNYSLSAEDEKALMLGQLQSLRIMRASGASLVTTQHAIPLEFDCVKNTSESAFEAFLKTVEKKRFPVADIPCFSAHQMGTCAMGGSPSTSVCNDKGESWDLKNLYVADGSSFPSSSGVNPMITIEAIAYVVAQNIKNKLQASNLFQLQRESKL